MCSRIHLDNETVRKARELLSKTPDWNYLLRASIRHAVAPLFYQGLLQVARKSGETFQNIPIPVLETFKSLYQSSLSRSIHLRNKTGEIAQTFRAAGVSVMGLKELGLVGEVYRDPGLRPMGDIDLLIHPEDYIAAAACLGSMGFIPLPRSEIPYTLKYAWGQHFRHPEGDIWVDLQWNIMQIEWDIVGEGNFNFEIERYWSCAGAVHVGGEKLLVPGLEDMLFHLCLHLEGHHYQELILCCDIAEIINKWNRQIDWQHFVKLVKKYQVESCVYYPLLLVKRFFQVNINTSVFEALRPAYLKMWTIGALNSNLTNLHVSLDDIDFEVHPPKNVMNLFEQTTRQQAAASMYLFRELDGLINKFYQTGGKYILLNGAPSERRFPDPLLEPFRPIKVIVFNEDLPCLEQAFAACGFTQNNYDSGVSLHKSVRITSCDPVLLDIPFSLSMLCKNNGWPSDVWDTTVPFSPRQIAMKTVRARLPGKYRTGADMLQIKVKLNVLPLSKDDILIFLAAQAGENTPERLYHLMGLVDFLDRLPTFEQSTVLKQSEAYGVRSAVEKGLAAYNAVFGYVNRLDGDMVRIFQWARLGPDNSEVDAGFKPLYFFVLSGLACTGSGEKLRYFLHALRGGKNKPFFPGILWKALSSRLGQKAAQSDTRMAYWLNPDEITDERIAAGMHE